MKLRDDQSALVAKVRARYVAGDTGVLAVAPTGSGKTCVTAEIMRLTVARARRALFLAPTVELVNQAVEKFAAAGVRAEIEQAGRRAGGDAPVVVASIASMRGDRLASWPRDAFGLVVHDEAHRTAAATSRAIVAHFAGAYLLGLTATPARGDGQPLSEYQSIVVGATVRELTDMGWLVPARVFVPAGDMRAGQLALDPAAAYTQHGANRPAVVFCASVDHATTVAAAMPVPTAVVHGEMSDRDRAATLARFAAGELRALTTCAVLVEGWDHPPTAVAILARRFGHCGAFLQACGRVLRPAPGKEHAVIVDLCGSALEHGLPDAPREYALTGTPIRTSDRLPIRQCRRCGCVSMRGEMCPACGELLPKQNRPPPKSADVGVAELGPGAAPRKPWVITMAAKRGGYCQVCSRGIRIGDPIQWTKTSGAVHAACGDARRRAA